jgi:hypothetical protein
MELIFKDVKPKVKIAGEVKSAKRREKKTSEMHGGNMGMLKEQMMKLLKKHKIESPEMHIQNLEGSGFFDSLIKIGKKAVDVGKKAYNVYKDNEKTINKAVEIGSKAVSGYKQGGMTGALKSVVGGKISGGKMTKEQYQQKLNEIKKKHNLNHKQAMIYYKQHKK